MAANSTFSSEPVRFEESKGMQIVGVKERLPPARRAQIPRLWERFAPYIGNVPGQVGATAYGMMWPVEGSDELDYMAAVEVRGGAGAPKGLTIEHVPEQRYAVFVHPDHVSKINETMSAIHSRWLPHSGYERARGPAFERYGARFDSKSGRGDIEIWVPVRPR
jgi:AraC family transcriptional regulator